jgi:hypothetical protein
MPIIELPTEISGRNNQADDVFADASVLGFHHPIYSAA